MADHSEKVWPTHWVWIGRQVVSLQSVKVLKLADPAAFETEKKNRRLLPSLPPDTLQNQSKGSPPGTVFGVRSHNVQSIWCFVLGPAQNLIEPHSFTALLPPAETLYRRERENAQSVPGTVYLYLYFERQKRVHMYLDYIYIDAKLPSEDYTEAPLMDQWHSLRSRVAGRQSVGTTVWHEKCNKYLHLFAPRWHPEDET